MFPLCVVEFDVIDKTASATFRDLMARITAQATAKEVVP